MILTWFLNINNYSLPIQANINAARPRAYPNHLVIPFESQKIRHGLGAIRIKAAIPIEIEPLKMS